MKNKGFTLIELLVVIAIIGLLSSVVLVVIDSSKSKAKNAAIKSNLDNARTKAQVWYETNTFFPNTYTAICSTNATYNTTNIYKQVLGAAKVYGLASYANPNSSNAWNTAICNVSAQAWVAEAPLVGSALGAPLMWCVDSTGVSKETSSTIAINTFSCPP